MNRHQGPPRPGAERSGSLTVGEGMVLGGSCVMLLASFLPWYEVDLILGSAALDAWQEPGAVWSASAVLVAVLVGILVLKRNLDPDSLPELSRPLSWGLLLALASAVPLLCVAVKLVNDSDFVAYGFYVAFGAAALVAAGGLLIWLDERTA
jgi:hypothetical protein